MSTVPDLVPSAGFVILAGALVGGIVSGIAGFGGGPVILAVWLLVLPPQMAAPLLTISFLFVMLGNIHLVRHALSWRRLWPFLLGGLIGGLGTPIGPLIGVAIDFLLLEISRAFGGFRMIAFGGLVLIVLALRPRGLLDEGAVRWIKAKIGGLTDALRTRSP